MEIINFSEHNSVINQYMAELRDKSYQRNRLLFRNNIKRVGEMMAYELSKTLTYKPKTVTTPLGNIDIPLPKDDLVLATVLRAGLPPCYGQDCRFTRVSFMFSTMPRMDLSQPFACTPTENTPRWVYIPNIWHRPV